MDRRSMLQYLASIAAGGAALGKMTGCAAGAPQSTGQNPDAKRDRPQRGDRRRNNDTPTGDQPSTPPTQPQNPSQTPQSLRKVRSENMYIANRMAPDIDLRLYGFKRALMLPAKSFTDGDGMSVRPKLVKEISERIAQIGESDFRGPFIFDLEGPMFAGGLQSNDPQTFELAVRRLNSAVQDMHSIIPGAIVSIYASPFVRKTRQDYAASSRAIQRLNGLTFYNPSLYQPAAFIDKKEIEEQAQVRQEYVAFAVSEAKRLGVPHVFPMVNHRFKGAGQEKNDEALTRIPREEFQTVQIKTARDAGAHGIVLWHADLHSMELSRNPKSRTEGNRARAKRREHFANITPEQLSQMHRDVLTSINEAFLGDG